MQGWIITLIGTISVKLTLVRPNFFSGDLFFSPGLAEESWRNPPAVQTGGIRKRFRIS
jgi:hypothetical protein